MVVEIKANICQFLILQYRAEYNTIIVQKICFQFP